MKYQWIDRVGFLLGMVLLLANGNLSAQQEQEVVSKNYKFNDGIYFSFTDFQQNKPALRWEEMRGNVFSNPNAFTVKAEVLKRKSLAPSTENLLDSIWGFSIGGIPYFKIDKVEEGPLTLFSGMRVRGRICYASYEVREERDIVFSAFNPVTDQAYRTAIEKRNMKIKKEKIILFETGEVMDYNFENMAICLKDDPTLLRALNQIENYELEEKMFKCLLIYNDRHAIKTNASNAN